MADAHRRIAAAMGLVAVAGTSATASPLDPSPPPAPAFELRGEVDLPLIALGAIISVTSYLNDERAPAFCAPMCDPDTVNRLDRGTAGTWSPAWATASDVAAAAGLALPAAALLLVERPRAALNDYVVVVETVLLSDALATIVKSAVGRPRPYLYGAEAPDDAREGARGGLSFYSAHTSNAFAVAVAGFQALDRLGSRSRHLFLAGGLAVASLVGAGRILSGNHFPTDVLAGAAAGAAVGVLIPALHRRRVTIAPAVGDEQATLQLAARF